MHVKLDADDPTFIGELHLTPNTVRAVFMVLYRKYLQKRKESSKRGCRCERVSQYICF
jgi:hypothetical protein